MQLRNHILLLTLVISSLAFAQAPANDNFASAVDLTSTIGSCSSDAAYTTINGTSDLNAGSNWNNSGPQHNVWFSFTAPTTGEIEVTIDVSGTKGTQQRTQLALWQSNGTTEVNSARYQFNTEDVDVGATGLTPGATYYISVDAYNSSYDGTFTICVDSTVGYDYYEGATDIDALKGTCSSDAAYTTIGASSDKNAGSCWNNSGPQLNRWFKFTAPTTGTATFTIDIGGTKGTQQRTQAAIWQSDGTTQVACKRYQFNTEDVEVSSVSLTSGDTYYLSVDAYNTSYDGTFTICFDTTASYDYKAGAIDIDAIKGSSSADAAYTTIGASGDENAGSCWNNSGPQLNRWFVFTAPSTGIANITVDIGGTKGTQQRTQAAIWQSDGTTEVACKRYQFNTEDVEVSSVSLTAGDTYYLSVDAYNTSYDGTFTLNFDTTASYDYKAGAIDIDGIKGSSSADAAYTTIGASGDENAGSCWNNSGPQLNRWFVFTAPTTGVANITVDIGGTKGTQQRTQAAIWESDGTTQVACKRYAYNTEDVEVSSVSLTAGDTYYLSVDAYNTSYDGTFTLNFDTTPSYDYKAGAIDIDGIKGSSSTDAAYTTIGASGDENAGSCWNNSGPQLNRWFVFTAPTTGVANITVDIGGTKGTQQRTQAAIWESDGTTEVACKRYAFNTEDVEVSSVSLTSGDTYYLSVDAYNTSYDGTFTLVFDTTPSYDYKAGAVDIDSLKGTCSGDAAYTTIGASGDESAGSCWNNSGPQLNRWFKFTAPTTGIANITIDIGGTKGTQQRTQAAIWESDGTTQVACKRYAYNTEDVEVSSISLTSGNTYYLSVDAYNTSYDGTFSICFDTTASYDYYEGAVDLTSIIGGCSSDAAYTTIGASGDKNAGSCWNNSGPQLNRWFKFTAPATGQIKITCDVNGTQGTQQRTQMALWESDGTTEVECKRYAYNTEDVIISAIGLTGGNTYYVSVDAYNTSYDGTFTMCLDDTPDYDFKEGAVEITNLNNWCSSDAEYTTIGATGDLNAGSCWNNSGPQLNRWFKFTAISTDISITVDIGGTKGTQQRTQLALWESDGTTQVDCQRYSSNTDDVNISSTSLTAGNTYYISVDAYNTSYDGTFTLCVNNAADTYYARQDGNWTSTSTWSTTGYGGGSASDVPGAGDIAYVQGSKVTVNSAITCAEVNLDVNTDSTKLIVDGATLTVQGQINLSNTGNNYYGSIELQNSATVTISDDLTLTRSGGNEVFKIEVPSGSSLNVGSDLNVNSSAGSSNNNEINVSGNLTVTSGTNLTQTSSGIKTKITCNGSSVFTAKDITFTATTDDKVEIELNSSAKLTISGSVTRGGTPYGILDCNDNSTVEFNGSGAQTLPSVDGSGTGDVFTYQNVTVNNTYGSVPQITLGGDFELAQAFTFTDGVVSTGGYEFYIPYLASVSGGNTGSYLDGKMKRQGNSDFTFQVGDGDYWMPVKLANLSGPTSTIFEVEHHAQSHADTTTKTGLDSILTDDYWDIDRTFGLGSADVTLYWKSTTRSGINTSAYVDFVIAHYDGADWESLGADNITQGSSGDITVNGVSDFSPFAFGYKTPNVALPVELLSFSGKQKNNSVQLNWITATEINSKEFVIERSADGIHFDDIATIKGQGNSMSKMIYGYLDKVPFEGSNYYRLRQVDFDDTFQHSNIIQVDFKSGNGDLNLEVFPNPATSNTIFYTSSAEVGKNVRIALYDLKGNLVDELSPLFISVNSYAPISFTKKPKAGAYILRLSGTKGSVYKRIVFR